MDEAVVDTAVETAQRISRGWLNGTTRKQSYGILLVTAGMGAASGVAGTVYMIKRKFTLVRKYEKVPVTPVMTPTNALDDIKGPPPGTRTPGSVQ